MSLDMASANPCEETSNWQFIYSKNVLLVHLPAHWISNADFLFQYRAMAPPALRECDPRFDTLNPAFPVRRSALTAF